MPIRSVARVRDTQDHAPRGRRFGRPRRAAMEPAFRAITLGPGHEDWGVVDPQGRVVYRGYMLYAARLANELSSGRR